MTTSSSRPEATTTVRLVLVRVSVIAMAAAITAWLIGTMTVMPATF